MSFFEELKRRNVVRVGIAYVVAAWVLLQLTEVLTELFEISTDIGKGVVLLLIIGFIPALIFAWAFEMTPEGIKREKDVDRTQSVTRQTGRKLDFAIIALLAVGLVYFFWESRISDRGSETAETQASAEPAEEAPPAESSIDPRSIAVLPFDNRSRLEEDEFFVEGVHDDLLTSLARIGSLKVISRTSVGKYADTEKTIPEIAAELGVANVMEGAVQRAGDTVRINVQLINAQTDEHLWAEIFDRKMTTENLFAIQSEISTAIADALEATLSPKEQERLADIPTDNMAAYNAYLRGRQYMSRRTSENLEASLQEFERAVELDPEYALAWVGISDLNGLLIQYGTGDSLAQSERADYAAYRALAIDDELGEAYIALAGLKENKGLWDESIAAYERGIELSPNYVSGRHWYGNALSAHIDRISDGVRSLERAAELDPLSSIVQANLYDALMRQGDFDRARMVIERLEQTDPDFVPVLMRLGGWPPLGLTRLDVAIPHLQKGRELDPGNALFPWLESMAHIALGDIESASALQAGLEDTAPEHWSSGAIAAMSQIKEGNFAGAKEAAQWSRRRAPVYIGFEWLLIHIAVKQRDYARARQLLGQLNPDISNPDNADLWITRRSNDVCTAGWVLMHTGDEERGRALLEDAADFMLNQAPNHMALPERLPAEQCLAALGEQEAALFELEKSAELEYSFFTWNQFELPMFDELRHEPRFIAVMDTIDAKRQEQRANLERMRAEGAL